MEHNTPKRKACDLCYRKRIKCDGQKPRCSNCVVYKSDCTFRATSRKAPGRRPKPAGDDEDLRRRVRGLEATLDALQKKVDTLERMAQRLAPSQMPAAAAAAAPAPATADVDVDVDVDVIAVIPSAREIDPVTMAALPPYEFVMPMVRRYLASLNAVLPLFDDESLLGMVDLWFSDPQSRSLSNWAAINIVLALAHHGGHPQPVPAASSPVDFLNNAQSVLTPLITGETELAHVQILLGLVLLFQGTDNLQPANVLIATALSLAHRLRLNFRRSAEHLEPPLSVQRCRVFWIAYVLDRDLSMRSKRCPIQRDDDLDLELPPGSAPGRCSSASFLRIRVELARIQGNIYESCLSVQAQNASAEARSRNVASLLALLERWTLQIPPEYRAAVLAKAPASSVSRFFGVVYATHLACRSLIVQAQLCNAQWMQSLQVYGTRKLLGDACGLAPLPLHWQELVEECRGYMQLFRSIPRKDSSFVWMTICSYLTGIFCLTANIMFYPEHEAVDADQELIEEAFLYVEEVAKETRAEAITNAQGACQNLALYANAISKKGHGLVAVAQLR